MAESAAARAAVGPWCCRSQTCAPPQPLSRSASAAPPSLPAPHSASSTELHPTCDTCLLQPLALGSCRAAAAAAAGPPSTRPASARAEPGSSAPLASRPEQVASTALISQQVASTALISRRHPAGSGQAPSWAAADGLRAASSASCSSSVEGSDQLRSSPASLRAYRVSAWLRGCTSRSAAGALCRACAGAQVAALPERSDLRGRTKQKAAWLICTAAI
jgi:hypothetical protein